MRPDAMAEIVADGVDPDRALADHAFAHRLARRAGTVDHRRSGSARRRAGSAVGRAVGSGRPAPVGRSRCSCVGVALARSDGLTADQIVVGAHAPWLTDEPAPASARDRRGRGPSRAVPGSPARLYRAAGRQTGRSSCGRTSRRPRRVHAGDVALVLRAVDPADGDAAASVAVGPRRHRSSRPMSPRPPTPGRSSGTALEHARGMIAAALVTARAPGRRRLANRGRRSPERARRSTAREAVSERTEAFDPFESMLGRR